MLERGSGSETMNHSSSAVNLEAFLAGTADGASAVDGNGVIVAWNTAAERILGRRADEAVGRPCHEIMDGRDSAGNLRCSEFCTVRNHARRCEPVHHFELRTRTRAGDPLWLDVSSVVLGERADAPAWILLFRDVTSSHAIESILREKVTTSSPRLKRPSPEKLTRRELEILRLMKEGATTEVIAGRLLISRATVQNHVQNVFRKLDVHNRLEAVALAHRYGL